MRQLSVPVVHRATVAAIVFESKTKKRNDVIGIWGGRCPFEANIVPSRWRQAKSGAGLTSDGKADPDLFLSRAIGAPSVAPVTLVPETGGISLVE